MPWRRSLVFVSLLWVGCPSFPKGIGDAGELRDDWPDTGSDTHEARPDQGDAGSDRRELKDGAGPVTREDNGCVPQCWSRVCGPDGCGGVCGVCPEGTTCSYDQSMCVSQTVQKPLGGPCGATEGCRPRVEYPGGTYPNPKWPGCAHDQCLEGPCVSGFCSRPCRLYQDVRVNGTDLFAPDGIEDPDSPVTDCGGGMSDLFDKGFTCVLVEAGAAEGLCYPKASFRPCEGAGDCPGGEACGFLLVLGNLERRCLAAPAGGRGLAEACGYDPVQGKAIPCEAWACSQDGCTQACSSDADCRTASCEPHTGLCGGTGPRCEEDSDCSAWACRSDVLVEDLGVTVQACGPRECRSDAECRDPGFYCLHSVETGATDQAAWKGRCVRRQAGGKGLGEPCNDDPDDGLPDVVCADRAYCLDGWCGAMCASDEDCVGAGTSGQLRCGLREVGEMATSSGELLVPVPLCIYGGDSWQPCEVQADCEGKGVCTPWVPVATGQVELRCMEPPVGSLGIGNCGPASWGQTCDTRVCLGGSEAVAGFCSRPCRDAKDCPDAMVLGTGGVKFVCQAARFFQAGTAYLADDSYVSWCLPVPAESTLEPCEPLGVCPGFEETCRAVVRTGAPGGQDQVEYRCVRTQGGGTGAPCDPERGGVECGSGVCAPTAVRGVGFCTTPCESDALCASLGGGAARCVSRIVIPREPPAEPVSVRECRVVDACVVCQDDRDCPDASLRCANVAALPYEEDFRCAPACESDADCASWGEGAACLEVTAPLLTSKTGKARVCAPLACP